MLAGRRYLVFVVVGVVTVFLAQPVDSAPAVAWDPPRIDTQVFRGAGRVVNVRFVSHRDVVGAGVHVTPNLAPYVSVVSTTFDDWLEAGAEYEVQLLVQVPPDEHRQSINGVLRLAQGRRTIASPLQVRITALEPSVVEGQLEAYFLEEFGTTSPPSHAVSLPASVIETLQAGTNLPAVFSAGSVVFGGTLDVLQGEESTVFRAGVLEVLQQLSTRGIDTDPLQEALHTTLYVRDDPERPIIPCGADAIELHDYFQMIGVNARDCESADDNWDTFVIITTLGHPVIVHTGEDIENMQAGDFFGERQSARLVLHEIVHATNHVSQCVEPQWYEEISPSCGDDREECYTHWAERLLHNAALGRDTDIHYQLAAEEIAPNLTCLEILNVIPPGAVVLEAPVLTAEGDVQLFWSRSGDRDFQEYRVFRAEEDDDPRLLFSQVATITDQDHATFVDTSAGEDTTHHYKIAVVDALLLSSHSNEVSVKTEPVAKAWVIRDDATGGDCTRIGTWDTSRGKTCTLTGDLLADLAGFTEAAITVEADEVTIDGDGHWLRGTGGGIGVAAHGRESLEVVNLNIGNFYNGIRFSGITETQASDVKITDTRAGIVFVDSADMEVLDSWFVNNNAGITYSNVQSGDIAGNTLRDNDIGILASLGSSHISVSSNHVSGSFRGIYLSSVADNLNRVWRNIFKDNTFGLYSFDSYKTEVFFNDFIDNATQAYIEPPTGPGPHLPEPVHDNYWADFDEPAEGCLDVNSDLVCDTPYMFTDVHDLTPWTQPDTAWRAS